MTNKTNGKLGFMPQLDGLRGVAILLVIVYHWFPQNSGINKLPIGPFGVTLFFVLSGFLITQILLSYKAKVDRKEISSLKAFGIFVIRRTIRIFPVYYLAIFIVFFIPSIHFLNKPFTLLYQQPIYYLLYNSNYLLEVTHRWDDILSPFWSLAVEEQFYIFFPFLILIPFKKNILYIILGMIFLGIFFRYITFKIYPSSEFVLTPTCLDAFGMGAIWAYFRVEIFDYQKYLLRVNFIGLLGFVGLCFVLLIKDSVFYFVLCRFFMSCMAIWAVANASESKFKILDFSPIRWVGKVSYSLYVFHMIIPSVFGTLIFRVMSKLSFNVNNIYISNTIMFAFLLIFASFMWIFFERPINNFKNKSKFMP